MAAPLAATLEPLVRAVLQAGSQVGQVAASAVRKLDMTGVWHFPDLPYLPDGDPKHTLVRRRRGENGCQACAPAPPPPPPHPNPPNNQDVYMPSTQCPRAFRPVGVFLHGGAGRRGDKNWGFTRYGNVGAAAARAGAPAIVANYRLAPGVRASEQVRDVGAVMAWVGGHAHRYGGDASRTVWVGHSAGAHLLAALAAQPASSLAAARVPPPAAALLLSAVLNVARLGASPVGKALVHPAFGDDPAAWRAASPAITCAPGALLRTTPLWLVNAAEDFHLHDDAVELADALAPAAPHPAAVALQGAAAAALERDAPAAAAALHADDRRAGITLATVAGANHATIVSNIGRADDPTTALLRAIISTLQPPPPPSP